MKSGNRSNLAQYKSHTETASPKSGNLSKVIEHDIKVPTAVNLQSSPSIKGILSVGGIHLSHPLPSSV